MPQRLAHPSQAGRRTVLRGLAVGGAWAALSPWMSPARAQGAIEATTIGTGLTLLEGGGGNVLVLTAGNDRVLVDSGAAAHANAVHVAVADLPGNRVAAVFNTHWHLDQVGGNAVFGEAGATIYAHEKTRQRLSAGYYVPSEDRYEAPLPAAAQPTETFYGNESTRIGDALIEYGYLVCAHTDGDIYVAFPELNVIAAGDVLSPARDPVFDWFGGGWLGGRVDALAQLLERSDAGTRFVPAYGPVLGRAEAQAEYDLMLELFERMVEHVRLGESAEDMLEIGVLDGLARTFDNPYKLLYDMHKGFWAHHNKLMPDIV